MKSDPLQKQRKEAIYIQILEGIHQQEADLLNLVKDRKLEEMYPNITREIVRKAYPTLLTDVQPNNILRSNRMKEIFELDDLVREFKLEFSSFKEKGNKSSTRARKKLSELAKYCATVRKAIQEEKNNPAPTV